MSPMNRRGKRRGVAVRVVIAAAVGILAVGAAFLSRPIAFSLSDMTWGAGTTSSSISLD
jgi:hypothetical protein